MAQPVVHFEIGAKDMAKSHQFYSRLFDWDIQAPEGMEYGLVQPASDGSIGGGIGPLQDGQSPYVTI